MNMKRLTIILIAIWLQFLIRPVSAQTSDSTDRTFDVMSKLYQNNSPLDYLELLRADFERKDVPNYFVVVTSPDHWIKEEHVPGLLKLIYSTDSTKSIMSVYSSYLTNEKFSSVGREAQNLIECFRTKARYPLGTNSYGPPDKVRGKELEEWWTKYKLTRP
jgi:hypothetical protein